jgi:NAD(P)-dependent dehydrogenase (short-subunit alcohol dehydrogenase family)
MRIVVFGAAGVIGRAVQAELSQRHEVIGVTRSSGDHRADMTDPASIETLLKKIGGVDALVCCAGKAKFTPLAEINYDILSVGLQSKLMGQVNVLLAGLKHLNDGGSVTVTSGVLTEQYVRTASPASMANGALEAFVKAAAIELPRGLRVNIVSPSVIEESMEIYGKFFRGFEAVPARRAALAYARSVEGAQTGQVYRVW